MDCCQKQYTVQCIPVYCTCQLVVCYKTHVHQTLIFTTIAKPTRFGLDQTAVRYQPIKMINHEGIYGRKLSTSCRASSRQCFDSQTLKKLPYFAVCFQQHLLLLFSFYSSTYLISLFPSKLKTVKVI